MEYIWGNWQRSRRTTAVAVQWRSVRVGQVGMTYSFVERNSTDGPGRMGYSTRCRSDDPQGRATPRTLQPEDLIDARQKPGPGRLGWMPKGEPPDEKPCGGKPVSPFRLRVLRWPSTTSRRSESLSRDTRAPAGGLAPRMLRFRSVAAGSIPAPDSATHSRPVRHWCSRDGRAYRGSGDRPGVATGGGQ
jgi:hypothetical protein